MNATLQFKLQQPMQPLVIQNTLLNNTSIEFDYAISDSDLIADQSDAVSLVVLGCFNAGGVTVLDTYSTLANAARVISLTQTYDFFTLVPTFATDFPSDAIQVTVKTSGPGPSASVGSSLSIPITGTGSPLNVVSAPVGTLYVNLSGGSGTTLWVKESGTGSTGWVGK